MILKALKRMYKGFKYSILASMFRKSNSKQTIIQDAERWISPYRLHERLPKNYSSPDLLFYLFNRYPEFRNLFYYRLKKDSARKHVFFQLLQKLYPQRESLRLASTEIGPGLFIQHGTCLSLGAVKIGENCWVNQQVTVGFAAEGQAPILGNGVVIRPGAKVFGKITIGDNSIIGANSVVMKDVPPNCTVAGKPARIIRRDGQRVNEKL